MRRSTQRGMSGAEVLQWSRELFRAIFSLLTQKNKYWRKPWATSVFLLARMSVAGREIPAPIQHLQWVVWGSCFTQSCCWSPRKSGLILQDLSKSSAFHPSAFIRSSHSWYAYQRPPFLDVPSPCSYINYMVVVDFRFLLPFSNSTYALTTLKNNLCIWFA